MEENLLVKEFFQKLTERNGKSIAANSEYSSKEIMQKLARKYDVTAEYKGQANSPTRDHFWVYEVDGQLYGLGFSSGHWLRDGEKPEYDRTDWLKLEYSGYRKAGSVPSWHPAGPDEWSSCQIYKILGKVTADDVAENVWNFLQDFGWSQESKESKEYRAKASIYNRKNSEAAEEEYKKVKSVINVEILESKFPQPEDFANEVYDTYDDGWSTTTSEEDIDTEFKIKLSMGHIPLYTGIIYPDLAYGVDGSYIVYENTDEVSSIWKDDDSDGTTLVELADKLPEGRLRDLYIKYVSRAVADAIDTYVKENSSDYELDW